MFPAGPRESLSVVVPTLDEEERLPVLLGSLGACGADAPEEVIVVDGGSRDRTVEVAERAGARVVRASRGRGAQLRRGAEVATGDLLLFLHADTRVAPPALAAVRRTLRDPGPIAAGLRQRIGPGVRRLINRTTIEGDVTLGRQLVA